MKDKVVNVNTIRGAFNGRFIESAQNAYAQVGNWTVAIQVWYSWLQILFITFLSLSLSPSLSLSLSLSLFLSLSHSLILVDDFLFGQFSRKLPRPDINFSSLLVYFYTTRARIGFSNFIAILIFATRARLPYEIKSVGLTYVNCILAIRICIRAKRFTKSLPARNNVAAIICSLPWSRVSICLHLILFINTVQV